MEIVHKTHKGGSKASFVQPRRRICFAQAMGRDREGLSLASFTVRAWRSAWQRSYKTSPAWPLTPDDGSPLSIDYHRQGSQAMFT